MASSSPPPRAAPSIAAMVGMGNDAAGRTEEGGCVPTDRLSPSYHRPPPLTALRPPGPARPPSCAAPPSEGGRGRPAAAARPGGPERTVGRALPKESLRSPASTSSGEPSACGGGSPCCAVSVQEQEGRPAAEQEV
ncbi:hypothetical protein EYF80_061878 [Liparis tanakae]|uniref:Uncharacterized protein n=1 Tax=Liparis tanakae TaxID=230148 RepID=A0A4Z2EHM7_9TELE|nr:hypothetical protein EYF80_061878 [Liparis tanakae]